MMIMIELTKIPIILIAFRFAVAPLLLMDALDGHITTLFLAGYILAVASDVFDGIIARRLEASTVKLRQADSKADICLYLCVAASAWLIYPQVIIDFAIPLLLAISVQLMLFTISLIKFHKLPSFHTYTAKIWGVTLLVATVALFGFNYSKTFWLAISLCIINSIEEIIMTLLLSEWQCDILSIFHVFKLRKDKMNQMKRL